jgi:hypothetical protein
MVLLLGAAYRIWRLLAVDKILDEPRKIVVGLGRKWADGDPIPQRYREHWAVFFECPYCLGFYVCVAWWAAWQLSAHWTLVVAVPFVLSAGVGLIRGNLDPPEE